MALKVDFPKGSVTETKNGKLKIEYNKSYENKFNNNLNKEQAFLDETVARYLSAFVSFKSGMQKLSIPLSSHYGSGKVTIGVPYARFQAMGKVMVGINSGSPWAKRGERKVATGRNLRYHSNRGDYPFERMVGQHKFTILKQLAAYSRRLNGL